MAAVAPCSYPPRRWKRAARWPPAQVVTDRSTTLDDTNSVTGSTNVDSVQSVDIEEEIAPQSLRTGAQRESVCSKPHC